MWTAEKDVVLLAGHVVASPEPCKRPLLTRAIIAFLAVGPGLSIVSNH